MNLDQIIRVFFKNNKGWVAGYIFFSLVFPLVGVVLPKLYGTMIEALKDGKDPNIKSIVILIAISIIMTAILNKIDSIFVPKLQNYIRENVVDVLLRKNANNQKEHNMGELISEIVKLPNTVRVIFAKVRGDVLPVIISSIFIVGRFMYVNVYLGIAVLIGLVAIFVALGSTAKECLDRSTKLDETSDVLHEGISELFDNVLNVYSAGTTETEFEQLRKLQNAYAHSYKYTYECINSVRSLSSASVCALFCGVIGYMYKVYRRNKISLGELISISITSFFAMGLFQGFFGTLQDLVFNMGVYRKIRDNIGNVPDDRENYNKIKIKDGNIEFKNVMVKLGTKQVLDNFSDKISAGDCVAIVGRIGSGKSTLVKGILKLLPLDSGSILIDGHDINDVDPMLLRSQITFVTQNPIPFSRSILSNITYGSGDVSRSKVESLLKKYNLQNHLTLDLDAQAGRKGSHLSGGQRMIVFLLRVLLQNKRIVILDEPTSSLDVNTQEVIYKMIDDIKKNNCTIIVISHDSGILKHVNKVISMSTST